MRMIWANPMRLMPAIFRKEPRQPAGRIAGIRTIRSRIPTRSNLAGQPINQGRTAIPHGHCLDGIPGNQVEGISPLYHVSQLDGLRQDGCDAVFPRMGARDLIETLGNVEVLNQRRP